ncbi:hydrogenase expression/formation protein HypE [Pseudenhygromyxa sp. WMMC2535]|uniref:hydrogenase expression/formation protein HypE n=1 Tax=Pseudenhygromyxa sp. WMMC2535 TaxID=2712867 RepID=UPI001554D3F4|nr:hydrogenase expression/formation protein HypE [Pseudenhygromyxa sp. WMMC2535]NVB40869.1 hydrogenase expression/formation protein HypE [Pseudenhygromyxa sp. WMMC2535]
MKDHEHPLFQRIERWRRRAGRVRDEVVVAAHGGGGKAMRELIDDLIVGELGEGVQVDEDQARFELDQLAGPGDRLAFTTDSYVVSPISFPGGDIGRLAVTGTVNDLAVSGAKPRYLSCALILEEGLAIAELRQILRSMAAACAEAGVRVVTGDTKVVPRGAADKLFITTAGVGIIPAGVELGAKQLRPDDVVLINGYLGDHGAAILTARGELALDADIPSDCAPLNGLVDALLAEVEVHAMRDVTRGGLSACLNELALSSEVGMVVDERALPVRREVHGFCEILGLDPVHLANEGKLVAAVPPDQAERALAIMRAHPHGSHAAVIARCRAEPPGVVTLDTGFGAERILDMLVGEQLPRIC